VLTLYVMSDCYLGLDQQYDINLKVSACDNSTSKYNQSFTFDEQVYDAFDKAVEEVAEVDVKQQKAEQDFRKFHSIFSCLD